ncbi:MAG: hypothetical protein ACRD96_20720, partial [Bryobacteraceae bacterium]
DRNEDRKVDLSTQTMLAVTVPTTVVLIGILVNNSRLNEISQRINDINQRFGDTNGRIETLERRIDQRLDDLKETLRADLLRVEQVMAPR